MISIVLPAHNEAAVIGRCLQALTSDARPGEFDILVVCNGCGDRTGEVAAAVHPSVRVAEIPTASKIAALELGDELAKAFPRLYVDADVTLTTSAARELAHAVGSGGQLAASPGLRLDTSRSSWAVRSYFRIWTLLPSVTNGLAGRGVYALSAEGRRRFANWPQVTADDHFINSLFRPSERLAVASCESLVRAPRSFTALLRRRVRVHRGNVELATSSDGSLPTPPIRTKREWLGVVQRNPTRLMDVPVYVTVSLAARLLATWRRKTGNTAAWDRDESSRLA